MCKTEFQAAYLYLIPSSIKASMELFYWSSQSNDILYYPYSFSSIKLPILVLIIKSMFVILNDEEYKYALSEMLSFSLINDKIMYMEIKKHDMAYFKKNIMYFIQKYIILKKYLITEEHYNIDDNKMNEDDKNINVHNNIYRVYHMHNINQILNLYFIYVVDLLEYAKNYNMCVEKVECHNSVMNNLNNQTCNKLINNYYNKKENNNDKNDHGNSHPQGNNNHQNKQNNILINRNTKETKPLKGIHTRLSTVNVGYGIKDAIGQIFKYKHKYNEYLNYGILCELRILYELNIIDLIYLLEVEEIMRRYNMKYEINETYLSLHIKDVIHNLYVSNYIVYLNYLVLFNPVHISKIKKNILIQIPMDIILKVLCPNVFISSYKKTNIININENSIYLIDSSDKENDRPMSSKRKRESKYKKVEKKKNSKEKCDKKITNEVTITNTELNNEGIKEETKELINEPNNPSIKKDTTEFFLETNMKRKNILLPHTGNKSESIRVIYASCLSSNKIYLRNINMCYDVVVFIKILRDLHFPIMLKGRKIDKYIDNIINIQKKVYSEEMEKIDDEKRFTSVESINNSFNINNMENIFRIQNVSYLERVAILECKKYCKGEKKYKYNNFNKNHRIKKKKCNVCKCTEQEKKNLGKISKEYMTACIEHSSLSYFFLKKEKNVIIIEGNVDKSDTLFKNFVFKKKVILNVYNCGTVCRFILPLLCLYICKQNIKAQEENKTKIKYIILKGCKQMENVRIIHPLVNVLRKCFKYIKIKYLKKKHYLPISISIKKHILNITHHDIFLTKQIYVDNYYSSQFISSLLLISPFSKNNTKLCLNYKHSYKTKNMINNDYTNKYIINKQKNIFYNNIKNNIKYKIRYLYNISHQEKKKKKNLHSLKNIC
ncbi:hypothetical protein, variant [Plasmodium falciparum FCH/4]|nr:hypothetical protein, variant [Plasmodium falciparum FCH/4]